jgi:hypothetical protein
MHEYVERSGLDYTWAGTNLFAKRARTPAARSVRGAAQARCARAAARQTSMMGRLSATKRGDYRYRRAASDRGEQAETKSAPHKRRGTAPGPPLCFRA